MRVLVVSASIGAGHDAAASALVSAIRQARPDCVIREIDTFRAAGESFVRGLYQVAIQLTPPLEELWYRVVAGCALARWFYREVVGARVARTLWRRLADFEPDVVVSTYPLGTAGLSWLRRRRILDAPVLAVLTDFAPHAFWVYPQVARYLVLTEQARRTLAVLEPSAQATVCAPPVSVSFAPPTATRRAGARARYGVPEDVLAVLITGGACGLGPVTAAVGAALACPRCWVVVVCGHNDWLRGILRRRYRRVDRLRVLGWVADMAELMAGMDVVVNNAGGMTATEALAGGRALVLFRPIAGHGRASAAALADAGLAVVGTRRQWLTARLTEWAHRPELLRAAEARATHLARAHEPSEAAAVVLTEAESRVSALGEQAS